MPFASVTWICSVVCAPAWPGTGDGVMMIVGRGTGITVTEVDTVLLIAARVEHRPGDHVCAGGSEDVRRGGRTRHRTKILHAAAVAPVDAEVAHRGAVGRGGRYDE